MKRFFTLCAVLLALSSLLLSAYAQDNGVANEPPDPATWMPDANLRKAVRAALRLNCKRTPHTTETAKLECPKCPSAWDNGSHGSGICHEPQIVIGWRESD